MNSSVTKVDLARQPTPSDQPGGCSHDTVRELAQDAKPSKALLLLTRANCVSALSATVPIPSARLCTFENSRGCVGFGGQHLLEITTLLGGLSLQLFCKILRLKALLGNCPQLLEALWSERSFTKKVAPVPHAQALFPNCASQEDLTIKE